MQVNKVFEVDQIVCGRENKGCQEYLVYWKGFDLSAATWEPVENLLSCADLIEQFQRKVCPIPGANPFTLQRMEKTKTVHVKMLLTRKNRLKRPRSKSSNVMNNTLGGNDEKISRENCGEKMNGEKGREKFNGEKNNDKCGEKLNGEKTKVPRTPDNKLKQNIKPVKKKRISEGERLLHDTLLHESKTMAFEKDSYTKLNGVYNENSMKYNCTSSPHVKKSLNRSFKGNETPREDLVLSSIKRGYMKIILNNTNSHNLLTITMLDSLRDCLVKATKNNEVKAVLLSNNGNYFCSGIDYTGLMNCNDDKEYKSMVFELVSSIRSFLDVLITFPKPLVCAVNGPTLEFGVALVLNSDIAYATAKASFDVVYSKIQLTPIGCITYLLPKIVGNCMANSMLYIGGRYSAVSACDRGLVLDMYGVNSFSEDMEKKMSQLTSNSGPILESTKRLVHHLDRSRLEAVFQEELHEYQEALVTKDVRRKLKDDWTVVINLYSDI